MSELWVWQESVYPVGGETRLPEVGADLVGYDVEATDGTIGKIDEASTIVGRGYMVVDTGWWIFGKKRLVPAGVVSQVNTEMRKVFVSCSKDAIKDAPDYDEATDTVDAAYQDRIQGHYSP